MLCLGRVCGSESCGGEGGPRRPERGWERSLGEAMVTGEQNLWTTTRTGTGLGNLEGRARQQQEGISKEAYSSNKKHPSL